MAGLFRGLAGAASVLLRGAGMLLRGEKMSTEIPQVGSRAPAFSAKDHSGALVTLERFSGRKHLVLFFFPKADTPG